MSQRTLKIVEPKPSSEYLESGLRNQAIGYSVGKGRETLIDELKNYIGKPDVSKLNEHSSDSNQIQVLEKVRKAIEQENYATALDIMFSEQIQDTHQTMRIKMELIRVYEGLRQGTSDMPEFSQTKELLKDEKIEQELMKFYQGQNRDGALLTLKEVSNSRSGTTELTLGTLEETLDMVQRAIRAKLKNNFQEVLPPHKLAGQEAPGVRDQSFARGDISAGLTEYFRIYEALAAEVIDKKTKALEHEAGLKLEKERVLAVWDELAKLPGLKISANMRDRFLDKISIMDLNQLEYLSWSINNLSDRFIKHELTQDQANEEIENWFSKKFSKEEFHEEIKAVEANDKAQDVADMDRVRKEIKGFKKAA